MSWKAFLTALARAGLLKQTVMAGLNARSLKTAFIAIHICQPIEAGIRPIAGSISLVPPSMKRASGGRTIISTSSFYIL